MGEAEELLYFSTCAVERMCGKQRSWSSAADFKATQQQSLRTQQQSLRAQPASSLETVPLKPHRLRGREEAGAAVPLKPHRLRGTVSRKEAVALGDGRRSSLERASRLCP